MLDIPIFQQGFLQQFLEIGNCDVGGMVIDVGHTAAHRFDPFGFNLVALHCQHVGNHVKIGMEKQCAVMQQSAAPHKLGISGDFPSVHQQVIPAGKLHFRTHPAQSLDDGLG